MKRTAHLTAEAALEPRALAASLSDLARLEALHPLMRSIELVSDVGGTRTWRCEDRIFGMKLVYLAEQRVEPDGLHWRSVVRQGALRLDNAWTVTPTARGARVDETMTFEGPPTVVLIAAPIGIRAHRKIFAAIAKLGENAPRA